MSTRLGACLLILLALVTAGCSGRHTILGRRPDGAAVTLAAARSVPVSTPLTVRGTMVEK